MFPGVQQWSYYQDLAIQSGMKPNIQFFFCLMPFLGHCTISSELASLRHSRLHRSLYNLVYTPNDELNYFELYMESCLLSSYLKFILDIHTFDKLIREKSNDDQQTIALTLFHKYLSIDAKYFLPINDEIRRTTLCRLFFSLLLFSFF